MGRRGPKSIQQQLRVIEPHQRASSPDRATSSAPPHLHAATQAWWGEIVAQFDLQSHQLRTLLAAGEAWDRYQQAREAIAQHGLSYTDGKGVIRSRPEVAIERDSRIAFLRAMRELGLKEPPPPPQNTWRA